jgi:polyhydroxyalkanoate synthesis regulator phasin
MSNSDPWRQWQALWAPFAANSAASPFAGPGSGGPASPPPGFASFADAGERFAAALREFLAGRASQASAGAAPAAGLGAAEQFSNFLRDQFAGLVRPPWSSDAGGAPSAAPGQAAAPALGPGREQILRAQRAFDAWTRLAQSQSRLQRMWSDTLRNAAAAFTSRLQPAPGAPLTSDWIDRLYDQWIECAEQAYATTAHGEEFADALAAQVNAAADWRRESAAGIEEWAKQWDLPTRSEINSLTLRLRELEAQLAALRARTAPAKTARSPAPPESSKRSAKTASADKQAPSAGKRSSAKKRRAPASKRAR